MKKIISLKTFPILIIIAMTLGACRQDDENDFQNAKKSVIDSKVTNSTQLKTTDDANLKETDPPVKNGTHWKNQQ